MVKKELDIAYFISFCIEQYKVHISANGNEVMDLFDKYGVTEYLSDNFEILHTQSRQWLLEEINDFIQQKRRNRMKLYHGSLEIVQEPRIIKPTRTLDYGTSFYRFGLRTGS